MRVCCCICIYAEPDEAFGFTESDKERIKGEQEKFYSTGFKTFLRESAKEDPSFLVKFIMCATGSDYLPYDKTFKINVEFDFSLDPQAMPFFHSCTNDIRFPGYELFFSDYHKFKTMMNRVINMVYNRFDMR